MSTVFDWLMDPLDYAPQALVVVGIVLVVVLLFNIVRGIKRKK